MRIDLRNPFSSRISQDNNLKIKVNSIGFGNLMDLDLRNPNYHVHWN